MTALELIARADALRPNQYGTEEKLRWLQRLDGQLRRELLDTHEPAGTDEPAQEEPDAYTGESELLCPFPYGEELYLSYLFCQIDLMNAEIEKYDQSAALFAAAWRQYADFLNRGRRPAGEKRWRL